MGKIWSKDAECEQLRKIKALIEETEVGSYIRTSFSGICEMCEMNIEDDAWFNMPDSIEWREEQIRDLKQKAANSDAKHGETILRLEHERDCLADKVKSQDAEIQKLGHLLDSKVAECEKLKEEKSAMADSLDDLQTICEENDAEIMRLKALLFDYMEKEMVKNG